MGRRTMSLSLVFQITIALQLIKGAAPMLDSRSSYFAMQENEKLKGHVLKRLISSSLLSCGHECMKNALCSSVNFKSLSTIEKEGTAGVCELNGKHGVFTGNKDLDIDDHKGFTFSMLFKECPDDQQDWVKHGHSCYLLLEISSSNWSDARISCQTHAADLPVVRSADENTFILDMILNKSTVLRVGVWLGLYREDDGFHWVDGAPLAGQYSAWAEGEPNNSRNKEKCVHMLKNTNERGGKWNDRMCQSERNLKLAVLCQKYLL